jgi:4-amino-4-deoxy-L-arabinose transferase-like glycosyltransferase
MGDEAFSLRSRRVLLVVLLLLAAGLRLYRLDKYPLPMHQDELSNAYDAYSIVETGADRNGATFPLVLRANGAVDYRPSLYTWLATVPIRILGFSPAAARLPSAILGIASLALLFGFARRLVNEDFALLALAFGVFSPWHITYSRLAHEGAMLHGFFVILILYLWQRTAERGYPHWQLAATGFAIGFSSSAYQTTRLIAPLLLLLVAYDVFRFDRGRRRSLVVLVVAAFLGAMPQLYVLVTQPEHFFARLMATVPTADSPSALQSAVHGLSLVFGPKLLFWPNMEDTGYLAARLLFVELPFFYLGFLALPKLQPSKLGRFRWYVYVVFAMAIIPAIVTAHSASVRVSAALLLLPVWTAAGVMWSAQLFARYGVPRKLSYGAVAAGAAASIAFTAYMYFGSATVNGARSNNALVQVGQRLGTLAPRYDRVFVVDSPWYAGLHVAAFSGMHPLEFQETKKVTVDAKGWDYITSVGKYRFLKPRELSLIARRACREKSRDLFVSRTGVDGAAPFDSVSWHNEKYYFTELSAATHCQ